MSLFVTVLVVAVLGAACGLPSSLAGTSRIEDSVVRISGTACLKPILATGFVVDDGLIVTVAHAIAGVDDDLRVIDTSGISHSVEVVGFDDRLDIAIMSVATFSGVALESADTKTGDSGVIAAMNSDSNVDLIDYEVLRIVNARSGDIYDAGHVERNAIDMRTSAQRGTSGAPLIDDEGRYVGMVFAISRDRDDGAYALAASEIRDYLASPSAREGTERGRCR